ncbi:unnamed protein product [Paramecium primaurelia]|uniref:Uncharacterized protein n=1 Tax=Paramecium primaurelia TaxID=5886 RepID=A0A8S1P1E3_PARPR|nr:unnamed protein product [Paramecium primaurelia]
MFFGNEQDFKIKICSTVKSPAILIFNQVLLKTPQFNLNQNIENNKIIDEFHKFSEETPITYLFCLQLQKERHDILKKKIFRFIYQIKKFKQRIIF